MNIPAIVTLSTPITPEVSTPGPDRLVSGSPKHSVANYFSEATSQFFCGRWSSTPGAWRVRYTENELCVITVGRILITDDDGVALRFGPGDAFVIPAGFSGIWTVLENCTKIYAIFESRT